MIDLGERRHQTERISLNNDDCPIFSTLCLNVSIGKNTSTNRKYAAFGQMKLLFKYLLDFFYFNQIQVCFGFIQCVKGCLAYPPILPESFKNSVQFYAVTMLRNVGYLVEQKLWEQKGFFQTLIEMAKDDNDKLYRLCLYLVRRATEYHFFNVSCEMIVKDKIK